MNRMTNSGFPLAIALTFCLLTQAATPSDAAAICELLVNPVPYTTASLPNGIASDDFNEDGIADLAVACNNKVSILIGQGTDDVGDGTFAAPVDISNTGLKQQLATGDFNEDGIADLAVPDGSNSRVAVFLGNGSGGVGNGTFGAATTFAVGSVPNTVLAGDFNEDGITDLAVVCGGSNAVSILIGQGAAGAGNGTFAAAVNYATGTGPLRLASGDFNEDGITDLAVTNNNNASNSVSVLIGLGTGAQGDGTFAAAVDYPTTAGNPMGITTGDFNEDGITDLAVVNGSSVTNAIVVFLGNGVSGVGDGTFAAAAPVAGNNGSREIATADLNGDGRADLVVSNITNERVQEFLGGGTGAVGDGTFALTSGTARSPSIRDRLPSTRARLRSRPATSTRTASSTSRSCSPAATRSRSCAAKVRAGSGTDRSASIRSAFRSHRARANSSPATSTPTASRTSSSRA